MNVLLPQVHYFSSIGLLKLLRQLSNLSIRIVGCSSLEKGMANGSMLLDKFYVSPYLKEKEQYVIFLQKLCVKEKIDFLISSDEEELKLIKKNEYLLNCRTIIPDLQIISLFTDKLLATNELGEIGVTVPTIYTDLCSIDLNQNSKIIFRQKRSFGSQGIWIADLKDKYIPNHFSNQNFIQEFIDGEEYTVDIFCDRHGILKVCIPRKRLDIRNGITYKCKIEKHMAIIETCKVIYSHFKIPGFSNVQFRVKDSVPYFIELNPRFAGTGIASSLASFNVMLLYINHFYKNQQLESYDFYMNAVAWDSIITRFYE